MTAADLLKSIEKLYGYPLKGRADVEREVKATMKMRGSRTDEYLDELLFANVHWCGEAHEGDNPFEGDDQSPEVLASHLCGLFALRADLPYGNAKKSGAWLLDLNPRKDGVDSPLYFRVDKKADLLTDWWLLENAVALDESERLFGKVQAAHQDVADGGDATALKKLADEMRRRFPRVCHAFRDWFEEFGVTPPGPADYPDDKRLSEAYRLLLTIARVLVARCQGDDRAVLDAKTAKAAMVFADAEGDYPPALVIRMLAPALSGSDGGKQAAREIAKRGSGVALTQRWAQLVIDDAGPFGS